jgi:hypothetical protein
MTLAEARPIVYNLIFRKNSGIKRLSNLNMMGVQRALEKGCPYELTGGSVKIFFRVIPLVKQGQGNRVVAL